MGKMVGEEKKARGVPALQIYRFGGFGGFLKVSGSRTLLPNQAIFSFKEILTLILVKGEGFISQGSTLILPETCSRLKRQQR